MATKQLTYTGLLNNTYYRPTDIDTREVLRLLQQARNIPHQLLPFKGIIHVIDYTQRRHVGISGPIKNMFGYQAQMVMENGLDIFGRLVTMLKDTPHNQHDEYVFSFNYRMRKANGEWMHLYQQGSYITDPQTHLPLFSIALVTDISPIKRDNSMVFTVDRKRSEERFFRYKNVVTEYFYPDPDNAKLSKREREILAWLAEGLSSKQIAAKLYLSESTIVVHRKNMLRKTNAKNIAELIRYGIERGLI
jgi:DNA-binding CsgD family transcriptional regulator